MTQLTFGEQFADKRAAPTPAPRERKETWYKGRPLSHSSITAYQACPQRWKFRYVDKVPEKPRSFFSFGKSVHAGLEFLFCRDADAVPALEQVLAHYKAQWLREGYETPQQEKWFYQEGERILRGFYAKHHQDFKRVHCVEYKFTFDIEGVPVTGFIDRVDLTEKGHLAIVDYKTGKAFDKSRVHKDPQLTLYQMATRELLGREIESVTLYHLNSLTALTVPAHAKPLEESVRAAVVETATGISENRFEARPDEKGQCQWCDYLQICPAFAGKKRPALPPLKKEALAATVDRLGRIDAKVRDLREERTRLAGEVQAHLEATGESGVSGEYFAAETAADPATGERRLVTRSLAEPEA